MFTPFEYDYMLKAILVSGLIGAVCAFLSCFITLKGWSLMGDALSHAVVPGVSLAGLAGLPFSAGAFIAGVIAALTMGWLKRTSGLREDAVIGVVFTSWFALGLLLLSLYPSNLNLRTIIFGNILAISDPDILQVLVIAGLSSLPLVWTLLHDYQRNRVMTLLDPTSDPLGKGFHIIQSTIAIGSGGLIGKGWLNGTQSHLEFIPERTTDFIFAVFSEEFGLLGNGVLLVLYLLLIGRGLIISANAPTLFSRLLAGALTLSIFVYVFVNMGMVSGILPVVGVPLPFVSYGGTAFVTLSLGVGTLMSIQRHRKLVQT